MTWNLWWRFGPWEARAAAIEHVVRAEMPDVVLLQEVWSTGSASMAHRVAERLGLPGGDADDRHVVLSGTAAGVGTDRAEPTLVNAIVSRWPLTAVSTHVLPRADGAPSHRRALVAVVAAPTGDWPVLCTHLDHRFDESAHRQAQCTEILRIVGSVRADPDTAPPMIIGGDFNAVPDSDEIRLLTGRRAGPVPGLVLSDCWEHVGAADGATWRSDNPYQRSTAWPDRRLDYVFVSWPRPKPLGNPVRAWLAGCDPVDVGHPDGPVVPSDHAAVVVDICDEVAPPAAPVRP